MRAAAALVTAIAVAGAAAGCAVGASTGGPSSPPSPSASPSSGEVAVPGLLGTIVAQDDTGLGSTAIDAGWIVVVPADRAADLWALADVPDGFTDVGHLGAPVDEDALDALSAVRAPIDAGGSFRLDAPEGPAIVCWADPADPAGSDGSIYVWGCAESDLPQAGELEAVWGEGGFGVLVRTAG